MEVIIVAFVVFTIFAMFAFDHMLTKIYNKLDDIKILLELKKKYTEGGE